MTKKTEKNTQNTANSENKKRNLNIRVKEFADDDSNITNMMMDPRYLRQSSALIQEALQKGFDVLQLANGDIVCTGTKTIVHRYGWSEEENALTRVQAEKANENSQDMELDIKKVLEAAS